MGGLILCHYEGGKLVTKNIEMPVSASVDSLFTEAAALTSSPSGRLCLTYRGMLLKAGQSLESLSLKPGATVMVRTLPEPPKPKPAPTPVVMSPDDISKFNLAFGSAFKNHPAAFNKVVARLLTPENMESLAAACPGLGDDLVAQAFLTKPELLSLLLDPASLTKVAAEHPSILEAAHNLAAAVHEEAAAGHKSEQGGEGSQGYYLDDMEDEDEAEEGEAQGGGGSRMLGRGAPITPQQLAQALSLATGGTQAGPGSGSSPFLGMTGMGPSARGGASGSGSAGTRITSDIFQAAMQQALAATLGGNSTTTQESGGPPQANDLSAQLASMREIMGGVMDEGLAVQALQIMGGDVQAAVDLLFSGWEGGDEAMQ